MKRLLFFILLLIAASALYSRPTPMIYIEQIYKLYESNLHTTHTGHKKNIFWLENSLKLPNIHPSQAIIVTQTWEEYVKYKILLRFHIHFLLTKEYVGWGWQFDKRDVTFYNMEWAEEIKKSFEIARSRYELAQHYWEETLKWSRLAYSKNVTIGWEQIESLNWQIENDEFDYDYGEVIQMRLDSLDKKIAKIDQYIKDNSP